MAQTANNENKAKWTSELNERQVVDKIANRLKYPLIHVPRLFDYFTQMDNFKWEWHIDPNVHSMIVVLETACEIVADLGREIGEGVDCNKNLDNITFEILSNLDCDGDVLFEKMNARGKALSSYDLLKSSLEEELEIQQLQIKWREAINNIWIDYCWRNSDISDSPTLKDVEKVELKLERFLLRMIGKSFFKTDIIRNNDDVVGNRLADCIFRDCDSVADNYSKYARYKRIGQSEMTVLDLENIFKDINSMLYQDDSGVYRDIASYLNRSGFRMHAGDDNNTLLDDFMQDKLTHDTRVMFYAMVAYLRKKDASRIVKDKCEFENFCNWMRFIRNVFLSANKNVRIDRPESVKSAIKAVDEWLAAYFNQSDSMLNFICNFDVNKMLHGQEKARLEEEQLKAKLRVSGWDDAIVCAENNPYLWGQIVAPLSWSYDASQGKYVKESFVGYMEKLDKLFAERDIDIKLLQACVALRDYRLNKDDVWGSLGTFNDDRDISWKRHLRECGEADNEGNESDENNGIYGPIIKELIDEWQQKYASLSAKEFLASIIADRLEKLTDWRYFICSLESDELKMVFSTIGTNHRYINIENGHVYMYRAKQRRSDAIRYELVTLYVYVKMKGETPKDILHVNSVGGACVKFTKNNDSVTISPSQTLAGYDITINGNSESVSVGELKQKILKYLK